MRAVVGRTVHTIAFVGLVVLCGCAAPQGDAALSQDGIDGLKTISQATSKDLMASMKGLWAHWDDESAMKNLCSLEWPPYCTAMSSSNVESSQPAPGKTGIVTRTIRIGPDEGVAAHYEFRRKLPISHLVEVGNYHVWLDQKPEAVAQDVEDLEEWALVLDGDAGRNALSLLWAVEWRGKWWWLPPGQYTSENEERRIKAQATSKGLVEYLIDLEMKQPAGYENELNALTWPPLRAFVAEFSGEDAPPPVLADTTLRCEFRRKVPALEFCEMQEYAATMNDKAGNIARQIETVEEWAVLSMGASQKEEITISVIQWNGKWWYQ